MRTVAQKAGVATSTVSKALRGDPTIPESRRNEIKEIADQLGYRPHPMVAALMAQLHSRRRRTDPHHIAWINLWKREREVRQPLLEGATRRAGELGYAIEVHNVAAQGISPARLRQILVARSQLGVIIPPVPEPAMRYPLEMEGFAAVTIGTSLLEPAVHRVSHNHYQGGRLACGRMRAKGYRRIGLVLSPWMNSRIDEKWTGAFMTEQLHWPEKERIAPLIVEPDDQPTFDRWLRTTKPDAILLAEAHVVKWVRTQKIARRATLPVAWLAIDGEEKGKVGVDYRSPQLGAAAVELVIGQMHRNERGIPADPHTVMIDGIWVEA